MKNCRTCKLEKPFEDFCRDVSDPTGFNSECRECVSIRAKRNCKARPDLCKARELKWKTANPQWKTQAKIAFLKREYGISLEQLNKLRVVQNDNCQICKERMKIPQVDHCHETGHIRGLLCGNCNKAMGLLRDSPANCLAAASYLQQPKQISNSRVDSAGYMSPC